MYGLFCLRISTIRLFVYLKKRAEEYMCNSWWKRTEKSVKSGCCEVSSLFGTGSSEGGGHDA